MSLAGAVAKLSAPVSVTRRAALVFDDVSAFPVSAPAETVVSVRMHLQRSTDRPTAMLRARDGDESGGQARAWVTDDALTAVGWTGLQIAPPEDTDGPPGDIVAWQGRRWEVIEYQGWDESFTGGAKFRRYLVEDRGAA